MRSTGTLLLAVFTAAAVALTGCSATITGAPAPTGGSSALAPNAPTTTDPVAWTDQVCGSLLPFVEASASGNSEPQTWSVHATGSVLVGAFGAGAAEPPVGAGAPVTVAEQPVRATVAAAMAARRRVPLLRTDNSLHGCADR